MCNFIIFTSLLKNILSQKKLIKVNINKNFSNYRKNIYLLNIYREVLKERGIIKKQLSGVKVLGNGTLDKKVTVKATRFSSKAVTKIEDAGGKAEVI